MNNLLCLFMVFLMAVGQYTDAASQRHGKLNIKRDYSAELVNSIQTIMEDEHKVPELERFHMEALGD